MPRSFDISTESAASVEQLHAAFGREDYWLARLGDDGAAVLDSLLVDPDGTVKVCVTQYLGRQFLPAPVSRVVPGDLKLLYKETWRPVGDGRVRGVISVSAGGLGSTHADNSLAPADSGSLLSSAVKVEVKIPLVGGKIEETIGAGLAVSIPTVLDFTTTWVAEHS